MLAGLHQPAYANMALLVFQRTVGGVKVGFEDKDASSVMFCSDSGAEVAIIPIIA